MRQIAYLMMVILTILACKKVETKVPSKLSDEQLAHLMLDLQFSEATLTEFSIARQDSLRKLYFLQFASIYKLTEDEIKEEVRILEDDPDKLKLILDRVKILADSLR